MFHHFAVASLQLLKHLFHPFRIVAHCLSGFRDWLENAQGVSQAGKGGGLDDERTGTVSHVFRTHDTLEDPQLGISLTLLLQQAGFN